MTPHGQRRWSVIEKVTGAQAGAYLRANAHREVALYTSSFADRLAPALAAPRARCRVEAEGAVTVVMEDVEHHGSRPLTADAIVMISHHLGGFAGRWYGRVPDEPWLFRDWIGRHAQSNAVTAGRAAVLEIGSKTSWWRRRDEALRLIDSQQRLDDVLSAQPATLCHHDATGANVFCTPQQTVLIDWESVGPGPVGADLASLMFSSVQRGDADMDAVEAAFDDAIDSYVDGLCAEAQVLVGSAAPAVRHMVDASIALRWKLLADLAEARGSGTTPRRGSAPDEPSGRVWAELDRLTTLLLDSAGRVLR